jgi:hypothetical protein
VRVEALEQAVGASPSLRSRFLGGSQGLWFVGGILVSAVMIGQRLFLFIR